MKDSVNNEAGGSYSNHCAINGKSTANGFPWRR